MDIRQIPVFRPDGLNNEEYLIVRADYMDLTREFQGTSGTPNGDFIGGMPVTLNSDCYRQFFRLNENNEFVYYITLKVDGERYLLFLSSWGKLYFIDRILNFYEIFSRGVRIPEMGGIKRCLLDGEYYSGSAGNNEFLVFDLLYYSDKSYIRENYYSRYDVAKYSINNVFKDYSIKLNLDFNITLKKWFPITDITKTKNIYSYIQTETNSTRTTPFTADGLILQPFDGEYVVSGPWNKNDNVLFKWKPVEDQTMDFQIKMVSRNRWELLTKSGYPFTLPGSGEVAFVKPTTMNIRDYSDGDVAEFTYSKGIFRIFRPRPNKQANSLDSVLSVMDFIKKPFTLDSLKSTFDSFFSESGGIDLKKVLLGLSVERLKFICLKDSVYFQKQEIKIIKNLYSTYFTEYRSGKTLELEFRFFIKRAKFQPVIDRYSYTYLLEFLMKHFESSNDITYDLIETNEVNKSTSTNRSSYSSISDINYRRPVISESKQKIKEYSNERNVKNGSLAFKTVVSYETKTSKIISLKSTTLANPVGFNNTIRLKNRYSFNIGGIWRIDLTAVKTGFSITTIDEQREDYELEFEYVFGQPISFDNYLTTLSNLYKLVISNVSYC